MREPAIFWWPGRIQPSVVADIGSTLDLLPTITALTDGMLPANRALDGFDISPALFGTGPSPRDHMIYYRGPRIFAARLGAYKAHFLTQSGYGQPEPEEHDPPLLYNLEHDPSEKYDVAADHPDVIARIRELVKKHEATVEVIPHNLTRRGQ